VVNVDSPYIGVACGLAPTSLASTTSLITFFWVISYATETAKEHVQNGELKEITDISAVARVDWYKIVDKGLDRSYGGDEGF